MGRFAPASQIAQSGQGFSGVPPETPPMLETAAEDWPGTWMLKPVESPFNVIGNSPSL
jgi:hypothetical protein